VVQGRFFLPHSARVVAARATAVADMALRVETVDAVLLAEAPAAQLRISSRLANVPRRFEFRDGALFETDDNAGADALIAQLRGRRGQSLVYRLERSWRWISVSVLVAAALAYVFVAYGIPIAALWLAGHTPTYLAKITSDQTLSLLDDAELAATTLGVKDRQRAQVLFDRVAAHQTRPASGYHLLFRHGGPIGANAFALPDGRVVMTDELWLLVRNDAELEGVFAHEMAHVNHAHGLQRVYQASLIPAALALLTGDPSQFSQAATVLPAILVQSSYSRAFEQQADDDAAQTLKRIGENPSHLADLLERMEAKICATNTCLPSWIGSHPDTGKRAARLRREAKGP
jgi:Zn-dependent protease with chaperone function